MRVALRKFLNRVDSIEGIIDLLDDLVHFGSQIPVSSVPTVEDLRQRVRQTGQSGMQPILDGSVLILTAAFQQFVTDVMVEYADELPTIIPTYEYLPDAVRSFNESQTGVALRRDGVFSDRFADFELRQFVTNLKNCQDGNTPYLLNGEAIALNSHNIRSNILKDLFVRLGIPDIWAAIDSHQMLNIWTHLNTHGAVMSRAKNDLNEINDIRNRIAHTAGSQTIGSGALRSYIVFQRALAEDLVEGLERHIMAL